MNVRRAIGKTHVRRLLFGVGGVAALYVVEFRNFLLFHSLVELFSVLVAFAVFVVTWNAREELDSPVIAVLGVSFLFVGGLDLLHALAYKGMGVFPGVGANLPTQLWIFGRYVEALSLLGAALLGAVSAKRLSMDAEWTDLAMYLLVAGYAVVVVLGLGSIFVVDAFPPAYVEGRGLTPFKVYSEYAVVALLVATLPVLFEQRDEFDERVFQLLVASVLLTVGSELAFTFYVDVYDLSNAVGHFFKLGSFYLIYLAVVKTGIKRPQKTLYRTLARREAEARKFEKAADHSGHAILITDRDGDIQYVNAAWERMTGYTAAEALGENPRILRSGEHDAAFYESMWETILGGGVWDGELVNERKNGERYVIHQTISPILRDDGEIQGFVAIHDEITEQMEYEERLEDSLQQSVQQLQVLARVLRHNIRNEMSVVLGNAEMVRDGASDPETESRAATIERAGETLLSIAEKQRLIIRLLVEPSDVAHLDLSRSVAAVTDRLATTFPDLTVTVDVPPELELTTIPELERAIAELVENAAVHHDRETATVTVTARRRGPTVEIRVEDDGPGIPPVERRVIAGGAEIDALLHSRGMGLWLVHHIVTKAGGTVRFEDAHPRGSVVTLDVPRTLTERRGEAEDRGGGPRRVQRRP